MSHDSKADYKCHEIVALKRHSNAQRAEELLVQVARQVQPIMRRREWRVARLSEFFPGNANLHGLCVNGGNGHRAAEIKLRLRPAHSPDSFTHYESILGTMLHELAHIVRSPHDAVFYKLLDELKAECEDLMAKGVVGTGQGFDAPSMGRLGIHSFIPQHNPPAGQAREAALKAAEERAKRQRLMTNGPRKLGGDAQAAAALTPREAAARAAERRARDNLWCPSERLGVLTIEDVEAEQGPGGLCSGQAAASQPRAPVRAPAQPSSSRPGGGGGGGSSAGRPGASGPRRGSSAAAGAGGGEVRPGASAAQRGFLRRQVRRPAGDGASGAGPPPAPAVVDLTGGSDDDEHGDGCCRRGAAAALTRGASHPARGGVGVPWGCPCCTLLNPCSRRQCEACGHVPCKTN